MALGISCLSRVVDWYQMSTSQASPIPEQESVMVNTVYPDSKVHGANMGPIWVRQDPGGPLVGSMNLANRVHMSKDLMLQNQKHAPYCIFTHLPLDKMAAISQRTFSNAFSWMKRFVYRFKFQWSLFLRVLLTIIQHWFMALCWIGDIPLSEPTLTGFTYAYIRHQGEMSSRHVASKLL